MKKVALLFVCMFMAIGTTIAQDKQDLLVDANYCIFLGEKVFHQNNGQIAPIKDAVTLNNGTVVNPNGSYTVDGKTMQMNDGECLGMSGTLYKDQEKLTKHLLSQRKKMKKA